MMERQIESPGLVHGHNILMSLNMKFYPIWFRGCREMALDGWLYWGQHHCNGYTHIMAVSDAHVFPGFLTLVPTQLFFPKLNRLLYSHASAGERRKYAGKKVCLNRGSKSQSPGHESDMPTTEQPGRGGFGWTDLRSSDYMLTLWGA